MNCQNLDQLLNCFNNKIEMIYELIPLSQLYDNYIDRNEWKRNAVLDSNHLTNSSDDYSKQLANRRPDLREISQMVIEMKAMSAQMRQLLKERKQQISCENIKSENHLTLIDRHFNHIHTNIPTFFQNSNKTCKPIDKSNELSKYQKNEVLKVNPRNNPKPMTKTNTNANTISTQELRLNSKSAKKKVISKDLNSIPSIAYITTEEFASIPQYMLCRLTYEMINRAIADINRTIGAKYKIVCNYSTKYSDQEMRKYVNFKEQENKETEGEFFCTINDLKELSDLKVDTTIRKILTCLRHCKRIREIRGNPPKLIRYAVIKSQLE